MSKTFDWDNAKKYDVLRTGLKPPSSNYSIIKCPYDGSQFRAYWWSIAGGGKLCPSCGAKFNQYGMAAQEIKPEKKNVKNRRNRTTQ